MDAKQTDPNRYGIVHAARIDFVNAYAEAYTARAGEAGRNDSPSAYDYAMRHAPVIARALILSAGDIDPAMMQAGVMGVEDATIDYPRVMPSNTQPAPIAHTVTADPVTVSPAAPDRIRFYDYITDQSIDIGTRYPVPARYWPLFDARNLLAVNVYIALRGETDPANIAKTHEHAAQVIRQIEAREAQTH